MEMQQYAKRYIRINTFLLSFAAFIVIFPTYRAFGLGLFLGVLAGTYNIWLLKRRVSTFTSQVAAGYTPKGVGTIIRLATVLLGLLIAMKFPQYISIYGYLSGLLITTVVIVIDLIFTKRDVNGEER